MSHTNHDLARLTTVSVSAVVCLVGGFIGSGAAGGTPVAEAADGALSAEATLLAPAGAAFVIWSVIYLGLIAYAVWQWLPCQRGAHAPRHRAVGWWVAASMLLNTAWLLTIQAGWLSFSVVVIVALALVLGCAVRSLLVAPPSGWSDRIITDGTLGLYLGWVTVATCANVTAALVAAGVTPDRPASEWIALAVLVVALLLALALTRGSGGNLGIALAAGWGIAWIGVGRLDGRPESLLVGWAAVAVVAVLVVGAALVGRVSIRSGRTPVAA